MPNRQTQGVIRPNKGYAAFRIVFGLFFVGLGINQFSHFPSDSFLPYFSLGIGILFIVFGIFALFGSKAAGNRIDLQTTGPSTTDRLAELLKLKNDGLISADEYETKRQEILKNL
jgi:hypothetical protein